MLYFLAIVANIFFSLKFALIDIIFIHPRLKPHGSFYVL